MAEQLLLDFDGPGDGSKRKAVPKAEPKKPKEPKPKPPPGAKSPPKPPPRTDPGRSRTADEHRRSIWENAEKMRDAADEWDRAGGDPEVSRSWRETADMLQGRRAQAPADPWTIPRHWSPEAAMRVLGVTSLAEVSTAYRKLVAKCHPDRPGGDARAMQAINSARDFLKALAEAMG